MDVVWTDVFNSGRPCPEGAGVTQPKGWVQRSKVGVASVRPQAHGRVE